MTNIPPLQPIDQLLPALPRIARLIQQKHTFVWDDLRSLLPSAVTNEEWALGEMEIWADILLAACTDYDDAKHGESLHLLMERGVPQAPAYLAIAEVVKDPPSSIGAEAVLPIRISKQELDLGELPVGEDAQAIIVASGGPGQVISGSDMLMVQPATFGPHPTPVTISVKGGSDSQMFWGTLAFENGVDRHEVEITAQWSATASSAPKSLAAHIPWTERTHANRYLSIKLLVIATLTALLILLLMRLLTYRLNPSLPIKHSQLFQRK